MLVAALPVMTASEPFRASVKIELNALSIESVSTNVPLTIATPSTIATAVSDRPQLAAEEPSQRDEDHLRDFGHRREDLGRSAARRARARSGRRRGRGRGPRSTRPARRASPSPSSARGRSSTSAAARGSPPPVFESRLPVGSSAKTTVGCATSERAIATRCCCPPDSSAGRCDFRSSRPTRSHQIREERRIRLLARDRERQQDVLLGGEHRQQIEELEHETDVATAQQRHVAVRERADVLAGDRDRPRCRLVERGEQVHQRRLARARRAHHRDELALAARRARRRATRRRRSRPRRTGATRSVAFTTAPFALMGSSLARIADGRDRSGTTLVRTLRRRRPRTAGMIESPYVCSVSSCPCVIR